MRAVRRICAIHSILPVDIRDQAGASQMIAKQETQRTVFRHRDTLRTREIVFRDNAVGYFVVVAHEMRNVGCNIGCGLRGYTLPIAIVDKCRIRKDRGGGRCCDRRRIGVRPERPRACSGMFLAGVPLQSRESRMHSLLSFGSLLLQRTECDKLTLWAYEVLQVFGGTENWD